MTRKRSINVTITAAEWGDPPTVSDIEWMVKSTFPRVSEDEAWEITVQEDA